MVTWRQSWRNLALLALFVGLLLVPPSFRSDETGGLVGCRPLGLEWRQPVSLSGATIGDSAAEVRMAEACAQARQDRQTLIIVVGFVVLGWLVVRRTAGLLGAGPAEGPRRRFVSAYVVEPSVSGELGEGTVIDNRTSPPTIRHLQFDFDDWRGEDIVETFPTLLVTRRLRLAMEE